jgi:hypothetical protein
LLYGRRLDQALEHVDGSRYALVHAVAKRARQITLWLTADPAELRAEAAPPPAPGELATRDAVALAESEILQGEVVVRWDPEGRADEQEVPEAALLEADALLLEGIGEEEEEEEIELGEEGEALAVPTGEPVDLDTLDEVEVEVEAEAEEEEEGLVLGAGDLGEIDEEEVGEPDELEGASLEAMAEEEAALDEDEEEM